VRHYGYVKEIAPTRFSTRLTVTPDGFRFREPGQAMILGAFVIFVLALCIGGCVSAFTLRHLWADGAQRVAYLLTIAILGWFLFRIVRSGTLIASPSGIVVRNLLRTHRLKWEEVTTFEEKVAIIGASQVPRRFLRIHFVNGRFRNFTELNDSRRRNPDVVADLVQRLSEMKKTAEIQPHRRSSSGELR
jgi:hypothetical protein